MAVLAARALSRTRERDGGPGRSPFSPRVAVATESRRMGWPAALVFGARGVLPMLHGRSSAGADCRVPAAELRVPALGPVCRSAPRRVAARDRRADRRWRGRADRAA